MKIADRNLREGTRLLVARPMVSRADDARLRGLVATPLGARHEAVCNDLVAKLNRSRRFADDALPLDVMRMDGRASCIGETSGEAYEVRLVYPWDAEGLGQVSIFSPLGVQLLGAVPGARMSVGGASYRIVSVVMP